MRQRRQPVTVAAEVIAEIRPLHRSPDDACQSRSIYRPDGRIRDDERRITASRKPATRFQRRVHDAAWLKDQEESHLIAHGYVAFKAGQTLGYCLIQAPLGKRIREQFWNAAQLLSQSGNFTADLPTLDHQCVSKKYPIGGK